MEPYVPDASIQQDLCLRWQLTAFPVNFGKNQNNCVWLMPDSETMPSEDTLPEAERKLLSRMNKVGIRADITIQKAAGILQRSESAVRIMLKKG